MLSYNFTDTRSISNSPCTPPAPCTLGSISHSCASPMHMCILLCARCFITSNHSYRAFAHALHATTSSCVITPTATAYAPHNLHPGGRTAHIHNAAPCTYTTHVHIHRDCACAFHLHSHLGRDAPLSATQIMRAARHLRRRNAPYRDAACAPQRAAVVT